METTTPVDAVGLLDGLNCWLLELRDCGLGVAADLDHLQATLEQSRGERLDAPADPLLVVMLCGPTAVGKSSLINAFAGAEISRPGLGATTSAAVLYVHEGDDPSRLFEYGEAVGQLARQPHSVVRHSRDELRHKVLVDTPDIDSVMQHHRELTQALVFAADLVVFVTTPEKYKTMQSAQWVSEQRRQRAMAFVLNKWDRTSFGLQHDRRAEVERDFRRELAKSGFESPVLFKVTCLDEASTATADGLATGAPENELAGLRAWLESGLSRSASAAIQERRRRAAWGRVAAATAAVLPSPIAQHPWVARADLNLVESCSAAKQGVRPDIATAVANYTDRSVWPATPGLFGNYARVLNWCAARRWEWRGYRAQAGLFGAAGPAAGEGAFGRSAVELLAAVTQDRLLDVDTRGLPLGPVRAVWENASAVLAARLAPLTSQVDGELLVETARPSLRRFAGALSLIVVELLIGAVLGLVCWRVGTGFVVGEYAGSPLLLSAVALIAALILAGHVAANLFFPSLKNRFRKELTARSDATVSAAWERARTALVDHVRNVDRLAQQGREFLARIDRIVQSLAPPTSNEPDVRRLFGEAAAPTQVGHFDAQVPVPIAEHRRVPKFE